MKNLRKESGVNLGVWLLLLCLTACNTADKKSSLEKDSVGGDMAVPNRVGGSETYETKLDEAAADYLKHITQLLLMEYHLLAMQKGNKPETLPALERLMEINRISFKQIEDYAAKKRVILPSVLLAEEQISIDSLKNLPGAKRLTGRLKLLKINGENLLKTLKLAADNREQDFKILMNEEFTFQQQKKRLVNSL
ncbi:hypothetical protein [Pedobacter sp. KLB.chiD]|uniref:hypothetical protein n=1 Tax=Pedobacter sp. KLB.chiD TaxID=3387402 RepID=UPI00399B078C